MVSGTRATTAGGSNGRVCSAVGTPVQVNTGPVRGVRSQYGLRRQRIGRDRHLPLLGPASAPRGRSARSGLPPGLGRRRRGRRGPAGRHDAACWRRRVTGVPSGWKTLTFTFSVSPAEATSRSASASTTIPDARTQRVLELGDLDREQEIGLRPGAGRRRQGRRPRSAPLARQPGRAPAPARASPARARCRRSPAPAPRPRPSPPARARARPSAARRGPARPTSDVSMPSKTLRSLGRRCRRDRRRGVAAPVRSVTRSRLEVLAPRDFDDAHLLRLVLAAPLHRDLAEAAAEHRIQRPGRQPQGRRRRIGPEAVADVELAGLPRAQAFGDLLGVLRRIGSRGEGQRRELAGELVLAVPVGRRPAPAVQDRRAAGSGGWREPCRRR